MAAVNDKGMMCLWDLDTGKQRTSWKAHELIERTDDFTPYAESINGLAFAPDGQTLASTGKGEVRLWEVSTGKLQKLRPRRFSRSGALPLPTADNRLAVGGESSGSHPIVVLYNAESGEFLTTLGCNVGSRGGYIDRVAFTTDDSAC